MSIDPVHQLVGLPEDLEEATGMTLREYLSDPQLHNAYAYGRNNPTAFVDPEGEIAFLAVAIPFIPASVTVGKALTDILFVYGVAQTAVNVFEFDTVVLQNPEIFSEQEITQAGTDLIVDAALRGVGFLGSASQATFLETAGAVLDVVDSLEIGVQIDSNETTLDSSSGTIDSSEDEDNNE